MRVGHGDTSCLSYGWRVSSRSPSSGSADYRSAPPGGSPEHRPEYTREHEPAVEDDVGPVSRLRTWREGIRRRPPVDRAYRLVVAVAGFVVIGVGVVLLPLPGPGWLIIFLGLGLLATEYEWSRRLLAHAKERFGRRTDWVGEQSIVVRALVGLGCLALVGAVLAAVLWWFGVPTWLPDWVPLVDAIPTRA